MFLYEWYHPKGGNHFVKDRSPYSTELGGFFLCFEMRSSLAVVDACPFAYVSNALCMTVETLDSDIALGLLTLVCVFVYLISTPILNLNN